MGVGLRPGAKAPEVPPTPYRSRASPRLYYRAQGRINLVSTLLFTILASSGNGDRAMRRKIFIFVTVVVVGAIVVNLFLYRQVVQICGAVGPFAQATSPLRTASLQLNQSARELGGIAGRLARVSASVGGTGDEIGGIVANLNISQAIRNPITRDLEVIAQGIEQVTQAAGETTQAAGEISQAVSDINTYMDRADEALDTWWIGWCDG